MIRPLTAAERAAQIWCRPEFSKMEMNSDLCYAISVAIAEACLEERDRNAKVAEEKASYSPYTPGASDLAWKAAAREIARKIRFAE